MDNMNLYEAFRAVPKEAQKTIGAGKLKGFTDINPMWRIKLLTETFGPCGIGWYTEVEDKWVEEQAGEAAVFLKVALYIKVDGEWSKPIIGIGGSKLCGKGQGDGINDEATKMAYTDALSICCKMLGMAADIYYSKDSKSRDNLTKYDTVQQKSSVDTAIDAVPACTSPEDLALVWERFSPEFGSNDAFVLAVRNSPMNRG